MRSSTLKRLCGWYVKTKVPLHLAVLFVILSGIMVWGSTLYFFRVAVGEVNVVGVGVAVCWDADCDNPVSSLSWGRILVDFLYPEYQKNVTVYVRNKGDRSITLVLNTSDWRPPIVEEYISLGWDYGGRVLGIGETVKVTLFLSLNSSLWFETPRIQYYSFNMTISARSP